jgi:hypothetical protein
VYTVCTHGAHNPRVQGSRLPGTEGVRVGVIPQAVTFRSTGTGEPDEAQVSRPVRGGPGEKAAMTSLAVYPTSYLAVRRNNSNRIPAESG